MESSPVRVMTSHRRPRATTNPYIVQLDQQLSADPRIDYHRFSWGLALSGRYDVFHTHWTEAVMQSPSRAKRWVKQALMLAAVLVMRFRRVAIVRTMHNIQPPDGLSPVERWVLRLVDGGTRLRIRINPATVLPGDTPSVTILHGHYVDWFARHEPQPVVPGRFGYFGLIRRYKGVETLISAFAQTDDSHLSLRIGGRPSTPELATSLREQAADDPRVRLDLHFLEDETLIEIATESEIVVLPYRFMHNSGSVLAALSVNRPVLVPDNAVNRALSDEVGHGWLQFFDGDELQADDLTAALAAVRSAHLDRPDLSGRSWSTAATDHIDAYRLALGHG
jgi:beta-1,4-mannosyltransferase